MLWCIAFAFSIWFVPSSAFSYVWSRFQYGWMTRISSVFERTSSSPSSPWLGGPGHEFFLYWLLQGYSGTLIAWEYEQKTCSLHASLFAENQWYQFCRANQSGPDCNRLFCGWRCRGSFTLHLPGFLPEPGYLETTPGRMGDSGIMPGQIA